MKSIKLKFILFIFLIAVTSCRKDERIDGPVVNEPIGDPTIEVISGVTGLVSDGNGNPISNAAVHIYNRQVKSDENGVFYVNNVGLRKTGSVVRIEKAGYFDGFKTFIPALGKKSFVSMRLVAKGQAAKIQSNTGGVVNIPGGAALSLPANGIVEKDGGATYNGEVEVYTHWYNPLDEDLGLTMPGNLTAIRSDETEAQLKTYGMIAVEMESPNGEALQLAPNTTADLKFPVPNSLDPPATVPLWYFDVNDGVWLEEGQANLVDGAYQAEVSHFSFWNCDDPYQLIELQGRLIFAGQPLANYAVIIKLENGDVGYGYTDNEGVFRGKVPRDEVLTLVIRHCDENILNMEIGSFDMDTDLGDIDVSVLGFHSIVQGILLDCFDQPAEDAYGLLRDGEKVVQVITPIADGSFSTVVSGCANKDYSVQFIDPVNLKSTDIIDISEDWEFNDLMDIRICDDLEEYIQFTVDGMSIPIMTEADVYISNNEKLIIRGGETNAVESFDLDVFATTEGTYNPSSVSIQGNVVPINPEASLICGDHSTGAYGCQFDLNITNFGSEYVTATFTGRLISNYDTIQGTGGPNLEYDVEGSLRLKIDEQITTGEISGRIWFDENLNGMKDSDEDRAIRPQGVSLRKLSGTETNLFPLYLETHNNAFKYTDLLPGTYEVRVYNQEGYEAVATGVGGDDVDCNFEEEGNFYISNELVISANEEFENIDMGFIPGSLVCSSFFYYGCAPNITVVSNFKNGLPPYTATFNGETKTSFDNPVFTLEEGGFYTMNMSDDAGAACNFGTDVPGHYNNVSGRVWRDVEGGTSNVLDGNDERIAGLEIRLFDLSGTEVDSHISSQVGFYNIQNVDPGEYYIEIETPPGLMILDQDTNTPNGNDINPTTGRSNIITVDGCNNGFSFDIGFKSI